jgi:Cu(I)/Ag(I) efflux system membrane protein CusA/SilA
MTVATDVIGLLPIMWSTGTGADVMKRIATPLVGGILTSGFTVLVIMPIVYFLWRGVGVPKGEKFKGFPSLKELSS